MKKDFILLQDFIDRSFLLFKFWAITYTLVFFGLIAGVFLAATNSSGPEGPLVIMGTGIVFLIIYFKNISRTFALLKFLKNSFLQKSINFQEKIRRFFFFLLTIFIIDLFLATWFLSMILKLICFLLYKNIKNEIEESEIAIFEEEKERKVIQKYQELEEKLRKYKFIEKYQEDLSEEKVIKEAEVVEESSEEQVLEEVILDPKEEVPEEVQNSQT